MAVTMEQKVRGGRGVSGVATPPDGGWGWMIVAGCFLACICTRAITRCVSIFFVEFQLHFEKDYSTTAWIHSLVDCTTMLCAPLGSFIGNRLSCRATVVLGGLLSSTGLVLSSFASSLEFLYIFLGVLTGLGFALSYTPAIAMVGRYFSERKALAYGIAMSGSGIGTFILAPAVQLLIEHYSWRGALLILGGFVSNLCVCGALMRPLEPRGGERKWKDNMVNLERGGYTATPLDAKDVEKLPVDCNRPELKRLDAKDSGDLEFHVAEGKLINGKLENGKLAQVKLAEVLLSNSKLSDSRLTGLKLPECIVISNNKLTEKMQAEIKLSDPKLADGGTLEDLKLLNMNLNNKLTRIIDAKLSDDVDARIPDAVDAKLEDSRLFLENMNLNNKLTGIIDAKLSDDVDARIPDAMDAKLEDSRLFLENMNLNNKLTGIIDAKLSDDVDARIPDGVDAKQEDSRLLLENMNLNNKLTGIIDAKLSDGVDARIPDGVDAKLEDSRLIEAKATDVKQFAADAEANTPVSSLSVPYVNTKTLSKSSCFCLESMDFGFLLMPDFLLLSVSFMLLAYGCSVPIVYLVPYALSVGVEHQQAAFLMSIFGVSGIVGNITFGWVTDRKCLRRYRTVSYMVAVGMEGLCCMFIPVLRSFSLLVLFSVLYGYFDGAYVALIPVVTSDVVGSTYLTSALGVVFFLHAIPYLISPPIGGWLVDRTGDYTAAFFLSGVSLMSSPLFLAIVMLVRLCWRSRTNLASKSKLTSLKNRATDLH